MITVNLESTYRSKKFSKVYLILIYEVQMADQDKTNNEGITNALRAQWQRQGGDTSQGGNLVSIPTLTVGATFQ